MYALNGFYTFLKAVGNDNDTNTTNANPMQHQCETDMAPVSPTHKSENFQMDPHGASNSF